MTTAAPTREEVLAEIAREIRYRREHWPRLIEAGRMTQKEADERNRRFETGYTWLVNHWPRTPEAPRAA